MLKRAGNCQSKLERSGADQEGQRAARMELNGDSQGGGRWCLEYEVLERTDSILLGLVSHSLFEN